MLGSSLIANFLLPKFAHIWVITCFRSSPKKPLDLTYFENGTKTTHSMHCPTRRSITERSALARCKTHHTKQGGPRTKTTTTTTCQQQHTTPNHPTTQPPNNQQCAAREMTQHHTTKKHKDTHVHAHAYVHAHVYIYMYLYMYVYVYMHMSVFIFLTKKTQSGTRTFHDVYCSKPLTFHNG